MLCYFAAGAIGTDFQINASDGKEVSWQTHLMLNSVLISIINIGRSRSIKSNFLIQEIINYLFVSLALLTVLEDEGFAGL